MRLPALCAVLLLATGAAAIEVASAAGFELPPLAQPASAEHHVGKVIWVDLVTPDLDRAKRLMAP